jgi:hypothetical protein
VLSASICDVLTERVPRNLVVGARNLQGK